MQTKIILENYTRESSAVIRMLPV